MIFLRIFKVVWFFSIAATLAVFMYCYAALPEAVIVQEGEAFTSVSREVVFYTWLALLAISNMLVFVVNRLYQDREDFVSWFFGLIICFNLFLLVSIAFVSVYNGGERFDYASIGSVIYGSIGLLTAWAIAWPVYLGITKITAKKPV